jgi:hypothetical protein
MATGWQTNVTAGAPITSTWGNTVRDRTVVPFTNAAQRDSQIPLPTEGMVCYLADVDLIFVYTTAGWTAVPSTSMAYQTWTPTWTGVAASYGNAAFVARYHRLGRMIHAYCQFNLGTSSTMASDGLGITLPTPAFDAGTMSTACGEAFYDNNGVWYHGLAFINHNGETDRVRLKCVQMSVGSVPVLFDVNGTRPFAWSAASTDRLSVNFTYEAAT